MLGCPETKSDRETFQGRVYGDPRQARLCYHTVEFSEIYHTEE